MQKLLWIILLSGLSFTAHARLCLVNMVSGSGHIIETFRGTTGNHGQCVSALRDCSKEKRLRGLHQARCEQVKSVITPGPGPRPIPGPGPRPVPNIMRIHVGDLVYPISWEHTLGATVLSINPVTREIRIRSNYSGTVLTKHRSELAVAQGCIQSYQQACVGDLVHPRSWEHSLGATILGINPEIGLLMIKSNYSGKVVSKQLDELGLTTGCLHRICVGQKVYPRSWNHSLGATVIAINLGTQEFIIRSNYSGKVVVKTIYDL